jgi:hypothetical protein
MLLPKKTFLQKQSFWRQKTLSALAILFFSALVLSACTSGTTSGIATPTVTPTPAINQTLQSEGSAQLQSFQQWIALFQQNGGTVSTYQQQYSNDQQALTQARTSTQYTTALSDLQAHVTAIKIPTMKQECTYLAQELQQQVTTWGNQHQYHDDYNNTTYALDYEYSNVNGIGGPLWLQEELQTDKTLSDYQQTVEDLNMWLYNFQQMTINFTDKTPTDQTHQTDLNLMQHYGFTNESVVVVSLTNQTLRAYTNGKLVHTFQVTTGQPDLPTPPGNWWIEGKQHPTVFKSSAPKGSADWYPDTPITYAMQYHSNGYFFHDAWWRSEFGPGTNFPHQDPDGDPFAGQGSHGCVNMSTDDAGWLYSFVSLYTQIIIY